MSKHFDKLMQGIKDNKFTIEELEAVVGILEKCDRLTPTEETVLGKMRWHIATAHNTSVQGRRSAHNTGDE